MDKRLLSGAVLVLLVVSLLGGCGGTQNGAEEPGEPGIRIITATPRATAIPTATPTPVVPVLEGDQLAGSTVEFWYAADPTAPDTLADLVAQFNAANEAGIEVVGRNFHYPTELTAAVSVGIASGQTPDVVLAEPYQYLPWVAEGQAVDLDPYLESAAYGLPVEDFYPAILLRDGSREGRWAFPGLFSAQVMLYNQTWAKELGFKTIPQTSAAFLRQACEAHDLNGDDTGGWMIDTTPGGAAAWILAFEWHLDQLLDFKSRQVEAAYTFLSDLYTQDCAWYPTEAYPDEGFARRQGLFYAANTGELGYVADAYDAAGSTDAWLAIGYPNPDGKPLITLAGQSYVVLQSEMEAQIASWLLIRYLTSEESQLALAESGLYLPLDRNTAAVMADNAALPEAWREALSLLDQSVVEPPIQQWGVLRSVLQDAQAEVLNERFAPGTMSLFLDQLDTLADEILR
jgi:multiple sugar transport system substrate-binding protein/sn-glycerol 3-phosphate transport system substrate-binding protein